MSRLPTSKTSAMTIKTAMIERANSARIWPSCLLQVSDGRDTLYSRVVTVDAVNVTPFGMSALIIGRKYTVYVACTARIAPVPLAAESTGVLPPFFAGLH